MRLQGGDIALLLKAMEDSFHPLDVDRLLLERFGLQLHRISGPKAWQYQVVDVHAHFDMRNQTQCLIAALRDARPDVPEIVALADRAGFTQGPSQGSLEVLVRKDGQPYQDVTVFRAELAKREAAVCRVETPTTYGTGSLIGPDLVLTNHHVIAGALDGAGKLAGTIYCLFDHKQGAEGYTTPGKLVKVTDLAASSVHAEEDLRPDSDITPSDRLDYALLRLESKIGEAAIVAGGVERGFIQTLPEPHTAGKNEGLLILQHPKAQPMKIDIGAVTWISATRLRHSVNTEEGSSGSPVFDASLNLVAIHHAGYDWPSPRVPYNQAIPFALIAAHAKALGGGLLP
ncbi:MULTISPECIES: trypsin-like peptidase domain-containing protein [Mesorhizobium]|uniref:trypsin-like peptidase domain-containing protein n=1 Tax=Mesorhizobium TaxID=68287 RepID=UPI0012E1AF80|nr:MULTISPECIES: trypsin-like peptidase domain-containing protein [Mesorhizobium]MUT27347.1 hypothetical protein [Mesorhizobium japonicum]